MKKFLSILTLVATVAVASIQYAAAQVASSGQVIVNANVTSNFNNVGAITIDCSAQRNVQIKWTLQLGGAGTEVMGTRWFPSMDGTTPTTPTLAHGYYIAVAANGQTAVTVQTNFDTLGARFLVGGFVTNGNATQVLTNTFDYFVKRNAP